MIWAMFTGLIGSGSGCGCGLPHGGVLVHRFHVICEPGRDGCARCRTHLLEFGLRMFRDLSSLSSWVQWRRQYCSDGSFRPSLRPPIASWYRSLNRK